MLKCIICSHFVTPNLKILRRHIRSHELLGEGVRPYTCAQLECRSSFRHLPSLIRHISKALRKTQRKTLKKGPITFDFGKDPPLACPNDPPELGQTCKCLNVISVG